MALLNKIDEYMKKHGLNKHQLAKESGIPYQTIVSLYNRGADNVKLSTLKKLANYFNCTLDELLEEDTENTTLPVAGSISCGNGVIAYEDVSEYQTVPRDWVRGGEYFFLRAKGDSMAGARIYDGDLLLIRRQDVVENGQIAAVLVGEEAFVKRVFFKNDLIILQSENNDYEPIVLNRNDENIRIIGKVEKIIIEVS